MKTFSMIHSWKIQMTMPIHTTAMALEQVSILALQDAQEMTFAPRSVDLYSLSFMNNRIQI